MRGMRAEAAAALAESARRFGHLVVRQIEGCFVVGDIDKISHLPRFVAFVGDGFVGQRHQIARGDLVGGKVFDFHAQDRQRGVRAHVRRRIHNRHLRIEQVFRCRFFRALQQFFAVENLQHAIAVGARTNINAVAFDAGRYRAMHLELIVRQRIFRPRLLAHQTEIADMHGLRRIGHIVHLQHAARVPALDAGDQVRDAGIALPEIFVRIAQSTNDHIHQRGFFGRGHVPDFVRGIAERAQEIKFIFIALGQIAPGTDTHHLRAAALGAALLPRYMKQRFRRARIGNINNRRAVKFRAAIERIHLGRAAVMPDIGNPAIALLLDFRVISTARVQIDMSQKRHVAGFRLTRIVFSRCARRRAAAAGYHQTRCRRCKHGPHFGNHCNLHLNSPLQ